jgi:hypothetical protein
MKELAKECAGTGAFFEQEEGFLFKRGEVYLGVLGEGVFLGDDEHQLLFEERVLFEVGLIDGEAYDADIEVALADLVDDRVRASVDDDQVRTGELLGELADVRGEDVEGGGVAGADVEFAGAAFGVVKDFAGEGFDFEEDFVGTGVEELTDGGGTALAALDEGVPQLGFE